MSYIGKFIRTYVPHQVFYRMFSSFVAIWLNCKPNQPAVGNEQCRHEEEDQVSDHVQIFRTAKMRGHGSRHIERDADRC